MIRLRPFKPADAEIISRWLDDERLFEMWCAGHYDYPLTPQQIAARHRACEEAPDEMLITALDDNGKIVGSFIMRRLDYINSSAFLGFIVVTPLCRGKGYGKQMLMAAEKYASEILGIRRLTLGVFDCNPAALRCYESAGFKAENIAENSFDFKGEKWNRIDMAWEV